MFVIAELGINHNGKLDLACHMATMAKECGVDAVKLQLRDIESCYSEEDLARTCDSPWGSTIGDKVRGRELSWGDIDTFNIHCRNLNLAWFASCFDLISLRNLHDKFPKRPFNKVPSGMAIPERSSFLEEVAKQKLITLISTGLCGSIEDVHCIAKIFEVACCPYVINHCVALYPCPDNRLNLNLIETYKKEFHNMNWPHCRGIGYSGHERGIMPSSIAASLGAKFVERHITLDRSMYGADQAASLEAAGLRRLVRDVKLIDHILGSRIKALVGDEKQPVKKFVE